MHQYALALPDNVCNNMQQCIAKSDNNYINALEKWMNFYTFFTLFRNNRNGTFMGQRFIISLAES